LERTSFVE